MQVNVDWDPTTSPKAYWSILKAFLNNKYLVLEKMSGISPTYLNKSSITDFREKAQVFNNFFAKQCTLVDNINKLPTDSFKSTNNLVSTISFTNCLF